MLFPGSKRAWLLGGLLLALTGAAAGPEPGVAGATSAAMAGVPGAATGIREVVILHLNDLHGYGFPREYLGSDLPKSWLHRSAGGLFSAATRLAQLREEVFRQDPRRRVHFEKTGDDGILFLEAGDAWSGTLDDAITKGGDIVQLLTSPFMGLDVSCPGNHAWDFGQERWAELSATMSRHHPLVCANLAREKGGPFPFLTPWVIREQMGVKIGVIGLITPTALAEAHPDNVIGLKVTDPMDALTTCVKEMRALPPAKRPDVIVVLSHVAFDRPVRHGKSNQTGATYLREMDDKKPGDDARPDLNVDLVVDGHSHIDHQMAVDSNTWLVQADHYALKLGEIRFSWDTLHHCMVGAPQMRRLPLFDENLPPDPRMLDAHKDLVSRVRAINEEAVIGIEPGLAIPALSRTNRQALDSPAGDLVTRAFLEVNNQTEGARADLCIINQSGVREGVYASSKGVITSGSVHAVSPFGNRLEMVDIRAGVLVDFIRKEGIQTTTRMSWAGLEVEALQTGRTIAACDNRRLVSMNLIGPGGKRENLMDSAHQGRILRVIGPSYIVLRELVPIAVPRSHRPLPLTDGVALKRYLRQLAMGGTLNGARLATLIGTPTRLKIVE